MMRGQALAPFTLPTLMTHSSSPHVAIIGGGPAGASTALALRRHAPGFAITLVESDAYGRPNIGETLHPAARLLLRRLGLWDGVRADRQAIAYAAVSVWGSDEPGTDNFLASRFGPGFQVDRRRFDASLALVAEQQGIQVLHKTRFVRAGRAASGKWRLDLAGEAGGVCLEADFVVDATGRRACFARQAGARRSRYDNLVGAFMFFDLPESAEVDGRVWIESAPYGWWHGAQLPDRRAAVACMSDHDIVRRMGLSRRENWLAAWAGVRHVRSWLDAAVPVGKPMLNAAQAGRLVPCMGQHWLAVGDAAAQFDPLSGQGLVQALRGGIAAAHAVVGDLAGRQDALLRYVGLIEAELRSFAQLRDHCYGLERRWPEQDFWRRRQGQPLAWNNLVGEEEVAG